MPVRGLLLVYRWYVAIADVSGQSYVIWCGPM